MNSLAPAALAESPDRNAWPRLRIQIPISILYLPPPDGRSVNVKVFIRIEPLTQVHPSISLDRWLQRHRIRSIIR